MELSNRQIGKIAREMCLAEKEKIGRGVYVRTKSYSEIRGGRRVKKYWLAFDSSSVAESFVDDLTKKGLYPIYKGWSYRIGCIVEIVKEEEIEVKPKKKLEVSKEDFNLWKYGCRFEPKYEKKGDYRPDEIEVSEEEVSIVIDEILFQMWSKSSVFLEVSDDGEMPFFYKSEIDDISDLSKMLKEVMNDRILKLDYHYSSWIADDLYGARKCWKSYLRSKASKSINQ